MKSQLKNTGGRGVLYVAYGEKARDQAQVSIKTLRRHAPGLPAAVVGDKPLPGADLHVPFPEADRGARTQKTQIYTLSPFAQTLFLDADTELVASPEPGFRLLQYVDLVLGQDVTRNFADNHWPHLNQAEVAYTQQVLGGSRHFMYFNSGAIFFRRNERVEQMMAAWHEEWSRFQMHDQMALLRAIHRCPVRIAPMRAPWNTHIRSQAAFIFHKHRQARREGAPK